MFGRKKNIVSSKIFKPQSRQKLTISHESEFVVIVIEGHEIVMQYQDALKFAANISHHAKIAKRLAGDVSKHMIVHADLTDAEDNDKHVPAHI